jgi:hypothetical protein
VNAFDCIGVGTRTIDGGVRDQFVSIGGGYLHETRAQLVGSVASKLTFVLIFESFLAALSHTHLTHSVFKLRRFTFLALDEWGGGVVDHQQQFCDDFFGDTSSTVDAPWNAGEGMESVV